MTSPRLSSWICAPFALVTMLIGFAPSIGWSQEGKSIEVASSQRKAEVESSYGELPLAFEPNEGQAGEGVRFAARARGLAVLLGDREISVAVTGHAPDQSSRDNHDNHDQKMAAVRMTYIGAKYAERPQATEKQFGVSNYLLGADPAKWHTGVANYGLVKYAGVYQGVDLLFYGNHRRLEHDFEVAAGADYKQIRVHLEGSKSIKVDGSGNLRVETVNGDLTFEAPEVYQVEGGVKVSVSGRYVVVGENEFGFELDAYDKARALVIDPVLSYSTYLAGSAADNGNAVALDALGNAYVTGFTFSADFPVLNAKQGTCNAPSCNPQDVFVTKLNPTGSGLVYSTFVGGTGADQGNAITVDSLGNAVVAGWTQSFDFPQVNGMTVVLSSYAQHGMAFSLTPTGAAFNFSTYLGGVNGDSATGVAVDTSGYVYVAGYTSSTNFPVTAGHQIGQAPNGYNGTDAFLVKFSRRGKLLFSTLIGGTGSNGTTASQSVLVGVDRKGEAVLAGTAQAGFPTTAAAFQTTCPANANGSPCAFVGRLNAAGTAFLAASYLGGSGGEYALGLAVDSTGIAYLAGTSYSLDFPTTATAFQRTVLQAGEQNGFVAKMNAALSKLTYATYLTGTGSAYGSIAVGGLAIDAAGNAYVTGSTSHTDFPLMSPMISQPPFNAFNGNGPAAFLTVLNPAGSTLTYSTLFSGSTGASGAGVAVDQASHAVVAGTTYDTDLPTTAGAFQTTVTPSTNGGYIQHAFVTEFLLNQANASVCLATNLVYMFSNYGKPSSSTPFTITNCGTAALKISAVTSSNPVFAITKGTCGTTVAAGASCTARAKYTPVKGVYGDSGTIQITDNAPISPQKLAVAGYVYYPTTGIYPYYQIGFGDEVVGVTSGAEFYLVQNSGFVPLHITAVTGTSGFTGVNKCPSALPPGGYCQIGATFTPTAVGLASGTLTVYDDAIDSPQTIMLAGNGLATYPTPSSISIYPSYAPAGSAAVPVGISGLEIFPTSTISINGTPFTGKVTEAYGALSFTLPASMLQKLGSLSIQVVNPAPGGASAPVDFSVYGQTAVQAADMVYEPFTRKFYASIPASATTNPNSLVSIDPATGAMGTPIAIGMDPGALGLSDDGQILYVSLNGENAVVPFNLTTQTAGAKIPLPVDILKGSLTAADIQVQPGKSGTVVVALAAGYQGSDGLALIVDGQVVSEYLNDAPNAVAVLGTRFADASNVYAWGYTYSPELLHFVIVGNQILQAPALNAGYGTGPLASVGTDLFDVNGQVYSTTTGALVGTISSISQYSNALVGVLSDTGAGRLYFMNGQYGGGVQVVDATTLGQVGSAGGPPSISSRLQKWGPDGLAYLTSASSQLPSDQLIQLKTNLFYPSSGPNAVPAISILSPATAAVGGANFVLTVTGSQFVPGAVVQWNGVNRTTQFVDSGTLSVDIPASDVAVAGTAKVRVVNPAPGGGPSPALTLPVL